MIMTHTEEVSTTFESKTPTEQMNGHSMASTESREAEEQGSSTTSPSEGRHADETSGSPVLEMGSMDSAGSAHSGGPSCGLVSSLFPSNCRGRAEAFARRLHRRLTSLGGEDNSQRNDDSSLPKETSWLRSPTTGRKIITNSSNNRVLQHQPRHNPNTDLCYDYDLEYEDGLSSPAEEATAAEVADLVVNPEVLKSNDHGIHNSSPIESKTSIDSESGHVFASPLLGTSPDSDSSDMFFDPESSDVEKPKNEMFFDPVTTSDSEVTTSNLSNGCDIIRPKSLPCRRRPEISVEHSEDTSESSASFKRNNFCDKDPRKKDLACSSEDSNDRSSQDTSTSPSHESLWSTFDESTMSFQDECPAKINPTVVIHQIRLPKSHSDSEIPVHGPSIMITSATKDEKVDTDEVDFINFLSENSKLENIKNARNLVKEDTSDSSENTYEEDLPYDEEKPKDTLEQQSKVLSLKLEELPGNETDDHSTYSSMINIPGALSLECPIVEGVIETTIKNEIKIQIENGAIIASSDEDKMCLLLQKLATSPSIKEDVHITEEPQDDSIEEEEGERPQKIRRCSSLKTGKTPPGTPGRKKIVRFADVLGLDLADVRTFLDEIPKVPNSAYSDLIYDDIFQKDTSPVNSSPIPAQWGARYVGSRRVSGCGMSSHKLDRTLVPLFQQPGGLPNFLDLVRERRVCLENVLVQDPVSFCIQGTVRVINLDFHKSVHIRYTLNSWRNFSDLQAIYVPNSCDGFSDKFSFVLYCHTLSIGQRLEFAVRFQCKGEQYWDNNAGLNYCFQCLPVSPAVGYMPITAQEGQHHEWSPVFY
ncbi:glycogen-binding subunit 76A isoform X1 [Bombus vosnesenskii]|uniref:Glycogen-binding subunit 76A isoform X1 n=2 Tax=Bombus vosnesenskii TaxID=207650 RepID=A0A6J3KHS6_9HYME|nr:glycogen-binding subunit 76A isoform X1 [Bombus vosnesenskii]